VLSGLGGVYNMKHDARAEQTLQRSLSLCETLRGRDANCAANTLVNLGVFAHDQRDNTAAEAYYRRAFAIRAPIIGADNPDLVPLLNNLANVYHSIGDDARALETHFQALHIEENALGPYHRYALLTAGNIAIISAATGDLATAIAFQRRTTPSSSGNWHSTWRSAPSGRSWPSRARLGANRPDDFAAPESRTRRSRRRRPGRAGGAATQGACSTP
jgi:tetratricopeptide (TPR) repeat protein